MQRLSDGFLTMTPKADFLSIKNIERQKLPSGK